MKRVMIFLIGVAVILISIGSSWAAAPRNGLVGEWLFEGNANDTSGNGNNGTVTGATLTTDRFERANAAYSFDGIDDIISVNNSESLNPSQLSISAWVKGNNPSGWARIVDKWRFSNKEGYTLTINPNTGGLHFEFWGTDNTQNGVETSSDLGINTWHHVVVTYDNQTIKMYFDGKLENSALVNKSIKPTSRYLSFGNAYDDTRYWPFSGSLDDIRIYNRAVSASEVTAIYHDKEIVISALTAFPTAGSAPLTVNFTCRAKSPNGTITQYLWDVNGDGITDKITSVGRLSYKYSSNGTYNASVQVLDSAGYSAESGAVKITVGNGPELTGKVEFYQYDDVTMTANIKLRVYNTGNVAAGAFKVNFTVSDNGIGPTVFKTLNISGLAAGQNTLLDEVINTFSSSIYGRQISIAIDSGKQIAEVDETNNGAKIIIGPAVTK